MAEPDTRTAGGELVIADRVGGKIATRAALSVDSVIEHQTGAVGALLASASSGPAGTYPQAKVDMSGPAPQVSISIAVSWPCALTTVCRSVRTTVADELVRLTGRRPDRVDVSVAKIVSRSAVAKQSAAGFTEIAAPTRVEVTA